MKTQLYEKQCIPCQGGVPPLAHDEKKLLLKELDSAWELIDQDKKLQRDFSFKGMRAPADFTSLVTTMADEQWHHPELVVGFNKFQVRIWTHKIDDLVESDFIFASKIDLLYIDFIKTLNESNA